MEVVHVTNGALRVVAGCVRVLWIAAGLGVRGGLTLKQRARLCGEGRLKGRVREHLRQVKSSRRKPPFKAYQTQHMHPQLGNDGMGRSAHMPNCTLKYTLPSSLHAPVRLHFLPPSPVMRGC